MVAEPILESVLMPGCDVDEASVSRISEFGDDPSKRAAVPVWVCALLGKPLEQPLHSISHVGIDLRDCAD